MDRNSKSRLDKVGRMADRVLQILPKKERIFLFILDNIAWFLVVIFYSVFAILRPTAMLNMDIVIFIFYTMTTVGLLVLAESIALISGNFDISIDRMTGFIGILAGMLITRYSINPYFGLLLPLIFGLLCGSLNGFLVGILKLNPFISTLATSMVFTGALLLASPTSIWKLPEPYLYIGGNMNTAILLFFCVLLFFWLILRYSRLGRRIYASGGDPSASLMLGIDTRKVYFITYCIVGLICGIAAIFYTGFCGAVPVNMAVGALFPAFAGAILGGISLRGGRGSVMNAFAGGLLFSVINAGLAMFAVPEEIRMFATGSLVVLAVVIGNFREIVRERLSRTL